MLSLQNNFGSILADVGLPSQNVEFPSPNTAGNGLLVVASFSLNWLTNPGIFCFDTLANTYTPLGQCSRFNQWQTFLAAWYVPSCKGGANIVTVSTPYYIDGNIYVLAVSIFEYAGGFQGLDAAAWGTGVDQPEISLSLTSTLGSGSNPAAADLLFVFGSDRATQPTVALDASDAGYVTEQTEAVTNPPNFGTDRVLALLAADKIDYSAGVKFVTLDFGQAADAADCMLFAALPMVSPPPAPPQPPAPPAPGTVTGWPTIF
jgi:hypothetical protein